MSEVLGIQGHIIRSQNQMHFGNTSIGVDANTECEINSTVTFPNLSATSFLTIDGNCVVGTTPQDPLTVSNLVVDKVSMASYETINPPNANIAVDKSFTLINLRAGTPGNVTATLPIGQAGQTKQISVIANTAPYYYQIPVYGGNVRIGNTTDNATLICDGTYWYLTNVQGTIIA